MNESAAKRLVIAAGDLDYLVMHHLPMVEAAKEAGFEVHIIAPPAQDSSEEGLAGVALHELPYRPTSRNPFRLLANVMNLRKHYRLLAPTIVVHLGIRIIVAGTIAARSVPQVMVLNAVMGLGHLATSQNPTARMQWWLIQRVLRTVSHSPEVHFMFQNRSDLTKFKSARITTTGNAHLSEGVGVDLAQFRYASEPGETPVVLLPARLLRSKGLYEFAEAARLLLSQGVVARFVLAGAAANDHPDGVPGETIDGWIAEGSLEWWGFCKDMPSTIAASHIVCLPSHGEGLSRGLCEAAATGRPTVTTDSPGCRDAVVHDRTGLLVPCHDAASLAEALAKLIEDQPLRLRMGRAARRHAEEKFDVRDTQARMRDLFNELGT